MYSRILLIVSALIAITFYSCTPEHSKIAVANFDKTDLTMGQFEKAYAKNVGGVENAKKDSFDEYKKFLDLFVNFRMKLRDAHIRGFEKDSALNKELANYEKEIGKTYYLEKELVGKGIKDLYEKRKYELRVSHILFRPDTVSAEVAKRKAEAIIDSIKHGKSYEEMARKYSDDKVTGKMGGDIYYITAGLVVPNFEDAAYATKVDSVYPMPVRTRFGYHVIKVTDKRKRKPEIRVSHIFISAKSNQAHKNPDSSYALIKKIKEKLDKGALFEDLVKKYSDDGRSKAKNGDLGYIKRRRMPKEFDFAAFNLKVGEVSNIVKTKYGYHIIKVTAVKPYPSFESEKENLKKMYKRARYDRDYRRLKGQLAKEYNRRINESALSFIAKVAKSAPIDSYFKSKFRKAIKDSVVFSYKGHKIICDSLFNHITDYPSFEKKVISKNNLEEVIKKYSDDLFMDDKVAHLEKTDPEFADLMKEYRNGLYIFKLQEEEVWNKLKIDTTDIHNYYIKHKAKYYWPEKVDFSEIYSRSDSLINKYYKILKNGADFDSLAAKYTERKGYKLKKGRFGLMEITKNPMALKAASLEIIGEFSKPFKSSGGWSIVKLNKRMKAHPKTYEEAKAEAASDYQEVASKQLENKYIESLKKIYHPEYFYDKLKEAYK